MKKIVFIIALLSFVPEATMARAPHVIMGEEDLSDHDEFDDLINVDIKRTLDAPQRQPHYLEVVARRLGIALLMRYTALVAYFKARYAEFVGCLKLSHRIFSR